MSPRSLLSDSIEEFIFVIIHLNLHDLIMFVVYVVILAISCYYFRSPIINNLHIPFFLGHCQARCPMVLGVYVCIVYCPTPFFLWFVWYNTQALPRAATIGKPKQCESFFTAFVRRQVLVEDGKMALEEDLVE